MEKLRDYTVELNDGSTFTFRSYGKIGSMINIMDCWNVIYTLKGVYQANKLKILDIKLIK